MLKRLTLLLFALTAPLGAYQPTPAEMTDFLHAVRGTARVTYGPTEWKREQFGWDLEAEVARAEEKITVGEVSDVIGFRRLITDLFGSFRDYHCWVDFHSTERASLPFTIRSAEGRYFLVSVDRKKLPKTSFPFCPGDEVLSFNGRPVSDVVEELKRDSAADATPETDQAYAELQLTARRTPLDTPHQTVTIEVLRKGKEESEMRTVAWSYQPEKVPTKALFDDLRPAHPLLTQKMVASQFTSLASDPLAEDVHRFAARRSMLPPLGTLVWETESATTFYGAIFTTGEGTRIGFLRIPHYGYPNLEWKEIADILERLEKDSDLLVLDQLNNYGGYVMFCGGLLSMLTDKPLDYPSEQFMLTQGDIREALNEIPRLEKITTDEGAKAYWNRLRYVNDGILMGIPTDFHFTQMVIDYYRFIINEWNEGRAFTSPYHRWGVGSINPSPVVNYTKPILLLINELDISCGDFFPAVMQDNGRATLMGVRTSGAGGCVLGFSHPNRLGIDGYHLTCSLLRRANGEPIENLGVTPDIAHVPTVRDRQENFTDFVQKIHETIAGMLSE